MSEAELEAFATEAGVLIEWEDIHGAPRRTPPETLRAVLAALGLPAATADELRDSRQRLRAAPPADFITVEVGAPFQPLGGPCGPSASLRLEDGGRLDLSLDPATGFTHRGVETPGYHQLQIGDRTITVAAAPPRAFGLEDLS
ncbi:MAG: hypothetical protein U1A07_23755, partial [Phenylobacterium sp.]|nr:hypothetical protein [Phenylobacterium sp.]